MPCEEKCAIASDSVDLSCFEELSNLRCGYRIFPGGGGGGENFRDKTANVAKWSNKNKTSQKETEYPFIFSHEIIGLITST